MACDYEKWTIGSSVVPKIGSVIRHYIGSQVSCREYKSDCEDDESALEFPPILGPEVDVAIPSAAQHFFSPVWRPDGGAILFVSAINNGPLGQAGNPLGAAGSFYKQDIPIRVPELPRLLLEGEEFPADQRPGHPRYSPTKVTDGVIAPQGDWLISYTAPGLGIPFGQFVRRESLASRFRGLEISRPSPDERKHQLSPQYGEWSAPGADPNDTSRLWLIHEECVVDYSFDSAVRSLVSGTSQTSIDVAYSKTVDLINAMEAPRFSQRTQPGWSSGWCVFMPGLPTSKFIAGAVAFGPLVNPQRRFVIIEPAVGRNRSQPQFSPDGKWLVFIDQEILPGRDVRSTVIVAPFPPDPRPSSFPIRDTVDSPWIRVAVPNSSNGVSDHHNPQWDAGSRRVIYEKVVNGRRQIWGRRVIETTREIRSEVMISERLDANYYLPRFEPVVPSRFVVYQMEDPETGRHRIRMRRIR